jgi:hypothetical protein
VSKEAHTLGKQLQRASQTQASCVPGSHSTPTRSSSSSISEHCWRQASLSAMLGALTPGTNLRHHTRSARFLRVYMYAKRTGT